MNTGVWLSHPESPSMSGAEKSREEFITLQDRTLVFTRKISLGGPRRRCWV